MRRYICQAITMVCTVLMAGSMLFGGVLSPALAEETAGNVDLKNLILDKVAVLSPDFSPNITEYTAETYYSVNSLAIFPMAQDASATISVNGTPMTGTSADVSLQLGTNPIRVVLQNGTSQKTYTINVTKLDTDYYGRKPISGVTAVTAFGNADQLPNLFDGDLNTYWAPAQKPVSETVGTPTSFTIDLGAVYPVSRMQAVMSNNTNAWENTARGRISVSENGTDWITTVKVSGSVNYQNAIRYDFGKIYNIRYVKYEWDLYTYAYIVRINEFTVYEDTKPDPPEYPAPEGGNIPFQPTNDAISHGQAVVLEKGFPLSGWTASDDYGRKVPNEEIAQLFGWDGPLFYDPPLKGIDYMKYSPNAHWALAKAPWGANGMAQAGEPRAFINESMMPYINNAISFCFGDEGGYSTTEAERYRKWFAFSRKQYPGTIVHSNQAAGIGWDSLGVWKEYVRIAEPDLLSFDNYYSQLQTENNLWNASNTLLSTNLWKLQRQTALEGVDGTGQKPLLFGQYLDSYNYDQPVSQKNLVVNLSLLSGMKWLNYFRMEYGFDNCYLFDEDGAPTRGFFEWAEINRYIKTVGDYLLRLNNDWVVSQPGQHGTVAAPISNIAPSGWHMGSFQSSSEKNAEYYISGVKAENLTTTNNGLPGDVLLGYFQALPGLETSDLATKFGCNAPRAFMVMNGLVAGKSATWNNLNVLAKERGSEENTRQSITLSFTENAGALKKVNRETGEIESVPLGADRQITVELGGGEAELYFWAEDTLSNVLTINDNKLGSGVNRFEYDDTWGYREPDAGDLTTSNGNDIHVTGVDGGTTTLRFYGKKVEVYFRKNSYSGVVSMQLDNDTPVDLDTNSAQAQSGTSGNFPILYVRENLENTEHTLKMVYDSSKGTGNMAWRGVSIDGARVTYDGEIPDPVSGAKLQTYVNDTTRTTEPNYFTFSSGWNAHAQANSNTGWTDSSTVGESYELHFYGTDVEIFAPSLSLGTPNVYLDGVRQTGGYATFTDTWKNGAAIDYSRPVLNIHAGDTNAEHVLKVEVASGQNRVDYAVVTQTVTGPPAKDLASVLGRAQDTGFCYLFEGEEQQFDGSRIVNGTDEDIARLKASEKGTLLVRYKTSGTTDQVLFAAGKDYASNHYGAILANASSNMQRIDFPDGMWANLSNTTLSDGNWHTFVYSVDATSLPEKQGKTVTSFDGSMSTPFPNFASWFNQNDQINDIQYLMIGGANGTFTNSNNNTNLTGSIAFVAFIPETFTQKEAAVLSGTAWPPEEPIELNALFYNGDTTGSDFFRIPFLWTTTGDAVIAGIDANFGSTGDSAENIDTTIRRKEYVPGAAALEGWENAFIPEALHMKDYADELGYKQKSASFIDGMILQDENNGRIHLMIDAFPWNGGGFQSLNVGADGEVYSGVTRSVAYGDGFATIGGRKYLLLSSQNIKGNGTLNNNTNRTRFDYAADIYGERNIEGRYVVYHLTGTPKVYSTTATPVDDGNLSLGNLSVYSLDEDYVLYKDGMMQTTLQKSADANYPETRVPMKMFYEDSELQMYNTSYIMQLYSDDGGMDWHTDKLASGMFKRENSKMYIVAPGRGIQLKNGPHAGRLLFPVYYQQSKLSSEVIYSDDGGVTWEHGGTVPGSISLSESALVEMPDGSMKIFMRNASNSGGKIIVATSTDGGESWQDVRSAFGDNGAGVNCQLSAIRSSVDVVSAEDGNSYPALFLSSAYDTARKNGRLFVGLIKEDGTYSDGSQKYRIDWEYQRELTSVNTLFGYSCMTELPDGKIGIFYETSFTQAWKDGLRAPQYKEFTLDELIL